MSTPLSGFLHFRERVLVSVSFRPSLKFEFQTTDVSERWHGVPEIQYNEFSVF